MPPVVFIHYNQKLCQKEITQFLDRSHVPTHLRDDHMISPYSNGNKIVCSEEKLALEVEPGGPLFLRVENQNYQHRLETSNNNVDINALLGYHVYYRELNEQQFEEQNMSKYEGMDICGGSRWQVIFKEHTSSNTQTRMATELSNCDNQEECCDESTDRCMKDENGKLWAGEIESCQSFRINFNFFSDHLHQHHHLHSQLQALHPICSLCDNGDGKIAGSECNRSPVRDLLHPDA